MNIVYFGNEVRGVRCLEALLENGNTICAVVGHVGNSAVVQYAQNHNIPTFQPEKVNASKFIAEIKQFTPDLLILAGYNQIFRKKLIDVPKLGALNLHGGKLPDYRGTAPINWQIIHGETIGGCCIIFVDEGIDTGDIVQQAYYEIGENDTAEALVNKQLELFPPILIKAVNEIENGAIQRKKQDSDKGAYFTRRYPKDSHIHWASMTAQEVHNLIRAMNGPSYPPAFSFYQGEPCYILESQVLKEKVMGVPARIALKRGKGMIVIAKDCGLLIKQIRLGEEASPTPPCNILKMGENFE